MTQFKYGKKPATDYGDANVTLKDVLAAPLPTAPIHFGHGSMFVDWDMLGNDQYGDCAEAGPDHEHMLFTGIDNHGTNSCRFTTKNTLSDYSAITGFNPNDPSTDQGTAVDVLMNYRRTTGMIDSTGKRHKIDLGARLSGKQGSFSWNEFINAVWCFKVVSIGTLVPESAERQFANGQPWHYVGDQNIVGGHYIPAVGSTNKNDEVAFITWGKQWIMTRDFFEAYVDELWVPLSEEAMSSIESALHIVDWNQVKTIASTL